MFLFTGPFEDAVEKATDATKEENWQIILEICDKAKESRATAKQCLEAIVNRLNNANSHVVLKAITLLDACVNNSGKSFHLEVASQYFKKQYTNLIKKSRDEVQTRLIAVLKNWAEGEFSKDSELKIIRDLYAEVKKDGLVNPSLEQSDKSKSSAKVSEDTYENDLAKAIELSKKEFSSPETKPSTSSSLYPSTVIPNHPVAEGRKVRALYDFEAAEDNELTFKTDDIITIIDDSDPNWWKGNNGRNEGLFPSNFVTDNLTAESEQPRVESKKTVQFDEAVKRISKEEIVIDEEKMSKLLHYLHEADPTDTSGDPPQMRELADEVNAMGPLIDAELEKVDSRHNQLSQLSLKLVDALNLYHSLMDEPVQPAPSYQPKPTGYPPYPQVNGVGPPGSLPMSYGMPGMPPVGPPSIPRNFPPPGPSNGPMPHYVHDPTRPPNGGPPPHFMPQSGYPPMAPGPGLRYQEQQPPHP